MRNHLNRLGHKINRKRVQRLMARMALQAIAPGPHTRIPHPKHKVYPYLRRGLTIDRPNQVWAADITYIPMAKGYMYPIAIIDWVTRKVLSWRVSNTLDTAFCVKALKDVLLRYGKPEIFNTNQGSQFTSAEFTGVLKAWDIQISMDGRGRCHDNIFVERLWRTVKYECVHLNAFEDGRHLREMLGLYFDWYNRERPPPPPLLERKVPTPYNLTASKTNFWQPEPENYEFRAYSFSQAVRTLEATSDAKNRMGRI